MGKAVGGRNVLYPHSDDERRYYRATKGGGWGVLMPCFPSGDKVG